MGIELHVRHPIKIKAIRIGLDADLLSCGIVIKGLRWGNLLIYVYTIYTGKGYMQHCTYYLDTKNKHEAMGG